MTSNQLRGSQMFWHGSFSVPALRDSLDAEYWFQQWRIMWCPMPPCLSVSLEHSIWLLQVTQLEMSKFQLDAVKILNVWTTRKCLKINFATFFCFRLSYCLLSRYSVVASCLSRPVEFSRRAFITRGALTPTDPCWKSMRSHVRLKCSPANHSAKQCRTPCALRTTCSECTSSSSECMWCSNMKQCVDSNAYVASFPFGQCMEWYTMNSCPRKTSYSLLSFFFLLIWQSLWFFYFVKPRQKYTDILNIESRKIISCYYIITCNTEECNLSI